MKKCVERESSKSNIDSLVQSCSDLCRIDSETYCLEEIELRFDNENLKKLMELVEVFQNIILNF